MTSPALTFPHLPPDDPANTPCAQCGHIHLTRFNSPACISHRNKERGEPCTAGRLAGQRVCRMHGGSSPQAKAAAAQRLAIAAIRDHLDSMGGTINVDPAEAMLQMVRESAWNVAFLREMAADLGWDVAFDVHGDHGKASEQVRAVVKLYGEERDRLMKYSQMCRAAGVEERMISLAEDQGRVVIGLVEAAFAELGLSEEQRQRVPVVMGRLIELQAGQGRLGTG